MPKLTREEIAARSADLPGWTQVGEALTKTFTFSSFVDSIDFVDAVAVVAEELGHHPDIAIAYTRVTMTLSTHDEGGVTMKDIALARRIEGLA